MIQQDQVSRFLKYVDSGGLRIAPNLIKGRQLKGRCDALSATLSGSVSSRANYAKDKVQELPELISKLAGELSSSSRALESWNGYIEIATQQEDFTQVAMGVQVKRMVDNVPNTTPAPSVLPITSRLELATLEAGIGTIDAVKGEIVATMGKINAVIEPPEESEGEQGSSSGGGSSPPPSIPPLSKPVIDEALALVEKLKPLVGRVARNGSVIGAMTSKAYSEREIALVYFKKGVEFTIGEMQVTNPAISDAAKEIYPKL